MNLAQVHQTFDVGDVTHHAVDGELVSTTFKAAVGGAEIYGNLGKLAGQLIPNPLGGVDFLREGNVEERTVPNAHGGHDVYYHGELGGSAFPNVHGGQDVYFDGQLTLSTIPSTDPFATVMQYADPLLHVAEYLIPAFLP